MNRSIGVLIVFVLLKTITVYGQSDSTYVDSKGVNNLFYQLQAGIIASESHDTKDYRPAVGIGIGYDCHYLFQPGIYVGYEEHRFFESVPLAMQIQGNFNRKGNSGFYYVQLGKTAMWKNDRNVVESVESGKYWEAGIGYQWLVDKLRLKISSGFREQKFSSVWKNNDIWFWDTFRSFAPSQGERQITNWHLERLHFKLTIEF